MRTSSPPDRPVVRPRSSHRCRESLCWPSHASARPSSSGVRPPVPSGGAVAGGQPKRRFRRAALLSYLSVRCPAPSLQLPHARRPSRLHRCLRLHARDVPASVAWLRRGTRSSRSSLRSVLHRITPTTTTSADFSRPAGTPTSPFRARREISPGKNADLPCTTAGFTPSGPWSRELRDHWLARPARRRLVSGSCTSARNFAPRFLHAVLAVRRSAVHFARCDQLTGGLPPPSQRPCRAHQKTEAFRPLLSGAHGPGRWRRQKGRWRRQKLATRELAALAK